MKDEEFLKQFGTIKQRVAFLCERYPEVKGSYTLLYQRYIWFFCGLPWYIDWETFKNLPSPESISRAYRKLKEAGDIQETLKTALRRAEREDLFRRNMPKDGVGV